VVLVELCSCLKTGILCVRPALKVRLKVRVTSTVTKLDMEDVAAATNENLNRLFYLLRLHFICSAKQDNIHSYSSELRVTNKSLL
jgi:hypothetical protein